MSAHPVMAALVFVTAACAPSIDERGFEAGAALAGEVAAGELEPTVRRLAEEHVQDVKVSCEGYPPVEGLPTCDLSRDAAMALVRERLAGLGLKTTIHASGAGAGAAYNVLAELRGERLAREVVLVGAHFDAHFAGADDNSSGVAAMLEVARVVARRRFARTVRFVGFDLEERGAVGSTRYVEAGLADDVVLALILECVGYASTEPGSQQSPLGMPLGDTGDFLAIVADGDSIEFAQRLMAMNHEFGLVEAKAVAAGGRGLFFLTSPLTRSDNGPFWLHRIPALLFSDTANLRNPNYHEPTDTPETLDYGFLADSTRLAAAAVALFAEVQP